jgi:propionyl-CoA synthetase
MGVEPLSVKPGSPAVPMPGYDIAILHPDGSGCGPGEEGAICLALPLPPGTLPTLWGDDARFESSYLCEHPGYYLTGDGGYLDEDGYLFVMGRIDDVINVAGHQLSTGAIEAVLATHPAVAECAGIGVADENKGQIPRGFVVLQVGSSPDGPAEELVALVRAEIGAVACLKQVDIVEAHAENALRQDVTKNHARYRPRPQQTDADDHRRPRRTARAALGPASVNQKPGTCSVSIARS